MNQPTPAALAHARRRHARLVAWLRDNEPLLACERGELCFRWAAQDIYVHIETAVKEAVPE